MAATSFLAPTGSTELQAGAYVTDGYHLFAILSVAAGKRHEPLVTYEDCHTLELLVCPINQLRQRHLELVRPVAADGGDPATR